MSALKLENWLNSFGHYNTEYELEERLYERQYDLLEPFYGVHPTAEQDSALIVAIEDCREGKAYLTGEELWESSVPMAELISRKLGRDG